MARIELVEYDNDEVGIKVDNEFNFYKKKNLTVASSGESVIKLFNEGNEIIAANTEEFITPQEASVYDLVLLIKNIISE